MPKVSVIIPAYNRADLIKRTIDSVLNQTFRDYEIIVVDDGSTDGTKDVLKKYNGKIKYIYQENQGVSSARNRGLDEAQGEYIAFLDADDAWMPEKLAIQVDILDKNKNVGIVYGKMPMFNEQGEKIGVKPEQPTGKNFRELIEIRGDLPTSTVLTRKECFDKAGTFDTDLITMQDFEMFLRIAQHYDIYEYKGKYLANYYRHAKQNTSNQVNVYVGLIRLYRKIKREFGHLEDFPWKLYVQKEVRNQYWLSRAYFNKKMYYHALRNLIGALVRYPIAGPLFFEKKDSVFTKALKFIKPYGYFVACLVMFVVFTPLENLEGRNKHSEEDCITE